MLIAALALASLAGCGEGSSETDTTSPANDGLTMTREDGSTVSFDDLEVSCGPSVFTGSGEEAIVIGQQEPPTSKPTEPVLTIEGILEDVEKGPATTKMANSYIDSDPEGAALFIYDPVEENELSSTDESSVGTITFEDVSCDPAGATVTVEGTVAPEIETKPSVEVSGTLTVGG